MSLEGRTVVDPHHHLWGPEFAGGAIGAYGLDDLHADTATVPEVVETVFMECGASYRTDGPEHLRPVGETEFVAAIAEPAKPPTAPPSSASSATPTSRCPSTSSTRSSTLTRRRRRAVPGHPGRPRRRPRPTCRS